MKLLQSSLGKLRSVSAVALILWFAGAGCVFVSYARGAMSADACSSEASHTSHQAGASASQKDANPSHFDSGRAASVSAAPASEISTETVVATGAHSCYKAKPSAAQKRTRPVASTSAPGARASSVADVRSRPQKASCAVRSQPDQRQPELSIIEIASASGRTLPSSGSTNCCPLTGPFATVATKARADDNSAAPLLERTALPLFIGAADTSPLTPPLRLPNRGHTYLRCCAFLI